MSESDQDSSLTPCWIAHPVVQTVIAILMLRRGQHRQFKYFFAYVVTQILTFAVVFSNLLVQSLCLFLPFLVHNCRERGFGLQSDSRGVSRRLPSLSHSS